MSFCVDKNILNEGGYDLNRISRISYPSWYKIHPYPMEFGRLGTTPPHLVNAYG